MWIGIKRTIVAQQARRPMLSQAARRNADYTARATAMRISVERRTENAGRHFVARDGVEIMHTAHRMAFRFLAAERIVPIVLILHFQILSLHAAKYRRHAASVHEHGSLRRSVCAPAW
jgi:hypothetical protein